MTEQIELYQEQRKIENGSLKMTEAEYKQNWADWQKAVAIRQLIESLIFDVKKVLQ